MIYIILFYILQVAIYQPTMKTPNFSLSIIAFILVFFCCISCNKKNEPVIIDGPDICNDRGEFSGSGLGGTCECELGFCGHSCGTVAQISYFGTYIGTMVCAGDTVITQIEVAESICSVQWGSELFFNDGIIRAWYWETGLNIEKPQIKITTNAGANNHQDGILSIDSLVFWMRPERYSLDTCFYVGVKI